MYWTLLHLSANWLQLRPLRRVATLLGFLVLRRPVITSQACTMHCPLHECPSYELQSGSGRSPAPLSMGGLRSQDLTNCYARQVLTIKRQVATEFLMQAPRPSLHPTIHRVC